MNYFKTRVIIHHTGLVKWFSPAILHSTCGIDTRWYPFDRQNCTLTFGSWAHHGKEIDIHADHLNADLSFYQEHDGFMVLSRNSKRIVKKYRYNSKKT